MLVSVSIEDASLAMPTTTKSTTAMKNSNSMKNLKPMHAPSPTLKRCTISSTCRNLTDHGKSRTKLLELVGVTQDQFTGLNLGLESAAGDEIHRATALAIAWLKTKVPTEEDVWEMVVDKAMGWLGDGDW